MICQTHSSHCKNTGEFWWLSFTTSKLVVHLAAQSHMECSLHHSLDMQKGRRRYVPIATRVVFLEDVRFSNMWPNAHLQQPYHVNIKWDTEHVATTNQCARTQHTPQQLTNLSQSTPRNHQWCGSTCGSRAHVKPCLHTTRTSNHTHARRDTHFHPHTHTHPHSQTLTHTHSTTQTHIHTDTQAAKQTQAQRASQRTDPTRAGQGQRAG